MVDNVPRDFPVGLHDAALSAPPSHLSLVVLRFPNTLWHPRLGMVRHEYRSRYVT
jgi:hypothetical protein